MGQRSLQASKKGLEKASLALAEHALSQNALAEELELSRSTVNKFFQGKPIDRVIFKTLCDRLGLNLEATVASSLAVGPEVEVSASEIDILTQQVRQKVYNSIQKRCGTMRVLDMEQPIGLDAIYTCVNILEKVTRNQRLSVDELLKNCNLEDFDRFSLSNVRQERVPGLEAVKHHDKLLILGKPGAGKTTFLKWLAIQCNAGELHRERVPIFVTLKEFAEAIGKPTLLNYIHSQFQECGVTDPETLKILLREGRSLLLLDGLDEVRDVDNDRTLQEIRSISNQFDASQVVMTCRIAAKEYTFEHFVEVEVADFDDKQIIEFSQKWFQPKDPVKAEVFPRALRAYPALKELATNPLLLTLLCLVFEERAGFPANRSELYKEGLDVLLKKWDAKRNIKRDEVYKHLSLQRKEDLLSQIAFTTFEQSEYFFKQKTVEKQIIQYICNLSNANTDADSLQLDSEVVLKSIEAQHGLLVERARGIYSFSHLTFHEYFTARRIKEKRSDALLKSLVSYITHKRWREVFLLTVGMLESADSLLECMKCQIDVLVTSDAQIQHFLAQISQKAHSVEAPYKPAAIRAFYFNLNLNLDLDLNLARNLDPELARNLDLDLNPNFDLDPSRNLDLNLDLNLSRALALARDFDLTQALDLELDLALDLALDLDPKLQRRMKQLKKQLSEASTQKSFKQWWQSNSQDWITQLRAAMIEHRALGYNWQFSNDQKKLLQQYYDANQLLIDCINSDCYISREVRQNIEETLLLPLKASNQ